jgi:hypothetical protein
MRGLTHLASLCLIAISGCNLTACAKGPTKYDAEDQVRKRLRDPDSAEFSDVEAHFTGKDGTVVFCGRVNSRNGMGGMAGSQRFIAGGMTVLEEDVGADVMTGVWNKFCLS